MPQSIGGALPGRLAPVVGTGVTLAAIAVIAVSLAQFVWVIAAGPGSDIRIRPPANSQTGPAQANLDYSILSRVTPFRAGAAPVTAAATDQPAPGFGDVAETSLDLVLHGIFSENEDGGHAFISTNGGAQTAYAIGDEIDGTRGVVLERFLTDSVLIRRDGVLESLQRGSREGAITTLTSVDSLEAEPADSDAAATDPGAGQARAAPASPPTTAIAAVDDTGEVIPPSPATQPAAPATEPATTNEPMGPVIVRRLTRTELETLALSIRLEENRANDAGGVFVYPTGNIDTFSKSGLEAGDIITEIAGLTPSSSADFERLLSELEDQKQITLSLVRADQVRALRVTLLD